MIDLDVRQAAYTHAVGNFGTDNYNDGQSSPMCLRASWGDASVGVGPV